jgi:hypothetical protein
MQTNYVVAGHIHESATIELPAGKVADMEALETIIKNYKRATDGQSLYHPEEVNGNRMTIELDAGIMVELELNHETPEKDTITIEAWDMDTYKNLDVIYTDEAIDLIEHFEDMR